MKRIALVLGLMLLCLGFFVYKSHQKDTKQGFVFGTYYTIFTLGENDIMPQIEAIFDEVNAKMSVFQKDSEINKVNELKANVQMPISKELSFVLQASMQVYEQSQGAFDPSLGTLIELWGFGTKANTQKISEEQIQEALEYVGLDKVILGENSLSKTRDNLRLNLSAIAKGYAVDRVAKCLVKNGYKNFLIDIGGEIYARGKRDIWGNKWTAAIQNPNGKNLAFMKIKLDNLAIATSGDYEKFIEIDGQKYSHTIDFKTGAPIKNKLASVTVLHESSMLADAYATALMAMGETKALAFAKEHNLNAFFLLRQDDKILLLESSNCL